MSTLTVYWPTHSHGAEKQEKVKALANLLKVHADYEYVRVSLVAGGAHFRFDTEVSVKELEAEIENAGFQRVTIENNNYEESVS